MPELDTDRQQIERLADVVLPPSFAETARAGVPTISPTPWELIKATEHHGAYIVNAYGADVCDLYAMSNPLAASVRNGGNSFPVHFRDADANAAFIVRAVNSHDALVGALRAALIIAKQAWDFPGAHPMRAAVVRDMEAALANAEAS